MRYERGSYTLRADRLADQSFEGELMIVESANKVPATGNAFWNLPREVIQPRYTFLMHLFHDYFGSRPFSMLEIGVHEGSLFRSSMDSSLNITSYYGVDPYLGRGDDYYLGAYWKSREEADEMHKRVESMFDGLGHELHRCTSEEFHSTTQGKTYDLIYIDGDHSFESCFWDVTHWFFRTSPDGLMVIDDYGNVDHPGVTKAVNKFIDEREGDIDRMGYRSYEMYSAIGKKPIPISKANVFFKRKDSAATGGSE